MSDFLATLKVFIVNSSLWTLVRSLSLNLKMTIAVSFLVASLTSGVAFFTFQHFEIEFKRLIHDHQFVLVSSVAREVDDKLIISHKVLKERGGLITAEVFSDSEVAQKFLDDSREALSVFDDGLFLFSPTGKIIAQSPYEPNMRGNDYSFREYYKQTVANGGPYISSPYRSTKQHHSPAIMFTVPVFDTSGRLNCILGGSLNLMNNNFVGAISGIRIGHTGFIYLFTADRMIFVHPDRSRIMEEKPSGENQGFEKALRGFEGSFEDANSNGFISINSFKRLQSANWFVAAHYPVQEAYAPVFIVKEYFYGTLLGAILLSILIVKWVMGYLITPLLRFTSHVAHIHDKKGEERWFRNAAADEIGTLAHTFNAMVAELDRQRGELFESKELYQIVADFSTDMAFWRSSQGQMHYISPHCGKITGYTDQEFSLDPELIDRIIHPDDRGSWFDHRRRATTDVQPSPLEFRIVTKAGTVRWVSHFCRLVYSESGDLLGERGSFSDITERKEMEERIKEQKEFVESLLQNAAVPLFVLNAQHKVIGWNRACEELTGLKRGDVIGTRQHWKAFYDHERPCLADIVLDSKRDKISSLYRCYSRSNLLSEGMQAEGWYPGLGGKDRYLLFDAAPVRNGTGELVAVIETLQDITELKKAEEQVTALRDYYLHLFQNFPALIWRSGLDAKCDYFNETWLDFTGRSLQEERGDGWTEGVHPDDLDRCVSTHMKAFEARQAFTMEYRLRRHDETYRWITDIGRPYYDPQGVFAGYVGSCYDISEQKQIEEKLRKLSLAVEQSPTSILVTDTFGTIEYVNSKFTEITGYSAAEVLGANPRIMKSGEHPEAVYEELWRTIMAGREWQGELLNRKKNGELYWEYAHIAPILDSQGRITHFLANKEDITARKMAEEKLRKSQDELLLKHEQLRDLFNQVEVAKKEWEDTLDCIGDVVILTDSEGCIRRCNRAMIELTGNEYADILGESWQGVLPTLAIAKDGAGEPGREIFHTPSGRWFYLSYYPFKEGGQDEITGAVITLHDTTALKKVTGELEEAYAELKETQAQMLQKEKMASIGQLAAGVAHEINNPIGFITSNIGTLGRYAEKLTGFIAAQGEAIADFDAPQAHETLAALRKRLKLDYILIDIGQLITESLEGADRVKKIVQDLKTFSRIDEAEHEVVSLVECIESTINIAWNELKYKTTLNKEYGDIPPIRCYPQQLNQVFLNLLVNAAHAIETQGTVTVKTWQKDDSVYISVTDTGCGIPEEIRNRIFEPFFTTKEVGEGTGLGLSISYDIIKKHGGELTVESEVGKGTTFTVRLPVTGVPDTAIPNLVKFIEGTTAEEADDAPGR